MKNLGIILTLIFIGLVGIHFAFVKPEKYETTDMYDDILERRYIKVGVNTDTKPMGFINEKGEYDGYNAELAREIAYYMFNNKKAVRFVTVTPSNRLIKLTTGEVDMIIASMTITPERNTVINFSMPYDVAAQALLVKNTSKVSAMSDLVGQDVGVIWGTTAEKNMLKQFATVNVIGFKNYTEAYNALKTGKICAITSDDTILNGIALEHNDVKLLPRRYSKEPYGIGIRQGKGSDKLRKQLDYAINDLRKSGKLAQLNKKWQGK